jgi:hypothetical protein
MPSRKRLWTSVIELILDSKSDGYSEEEKEHETPLPLSVARQLHLNSNNNFESVNYFTGCLSSRCLAML